MAKELIKVDLSGLSIDDKVKFIELFNFKKESMSIKDIVNLWNRFIKKPNQFVAMKRGGKHENSPVVRRKLSWTDVSIYDGRITTTYCYNNTRMLNYESDFGI